MLCVALAFSEPATVFVRLRDRQVSQVVHVVVFVVAVDVVYDLVRRPRTQERQRNQRMHVERPGPTVHVDVDLVVAVTVTTGPQ